VVGGAPCRTSALRRRRLLPALSAATLTLVKPWPVKRNQRCQHCRHSCSNDDDGTSGRARRPHHFSCPLLPNHTYLPRVHAGNLFGRPSSTGTAMTTSTMGPLGGSGGPIACPAHCRQTTHTYHACAQATYLASQAALAQRRGLWAGLAACLAARRRAGPRGRPRCWVSCPLQGERRHDGKTRTGRQPRQSMAQRANGDTAWRGPSKLYRPGATVGSSAHALPEQQRQWQGSLTGVWAGVAARQLWPGGCAVTCG
jgi:hypothetical protein